MSVKQIQVLGHLFEGPYEINTSFNDVAGIYLISKNDGVVVDVGETDQLGVRIPNHERQNCWNSNDALFLWFHGESSQSLRLSKEKKLRYEFDPVCGIK